MSILPNGIQGLPSCSPPQPLSPDTSSLHGTSLSGDPPARPLSGSPPAGDAGIPGPLAPIAEGSGGSSQKVSQLASTNGKKFGSSKSRGRSPATAALRNQRDTGSTDSQAMSMLSIGRKSHAISGNHLLNFHYDPISRLHPGPPPPRRTHKIKPYNKDLFLQANYKFFMLDSGKYLPESTDPDKMLQWEDIICVKYSTPSTVQCPICLDYPLCPQITSCGHIFCFPCILQYLVMGEDSNKGECFKRCPLCFVTICRKDLCTVYIELVKQYRVGDSIEFMLLTRQKDSFTPTQKSKQGNTVDEQDRSDIGLFSKFTFTSDVDLSVRRAVADLDGWLARAESGLVDDLEKRTYVSAAMKELEKRKRNWNELRASNGNKSCKYSSSQPESHLLPLAGSATNTEVCKIRSGMLFTDGDDLNNMKESGDDKSNFESSLNYAVDAVSTGQKDSGLQDNGNHERHLSSSGDAKESNSYNFYQAVDGQNIILHPLSMKCLLYHYGSYNMLPHRISGKILEMETVTQSEAIRRRYRYLSHFSLTTTFQLCEIDLRDLLPSDALLPFVDEIKKRENKRKQLAKKERREKIKAETAAEIPMSILFDIGQSSQPSTYSMDDFQALGGASVLSTSPPIVAERRTFSNVTRHGFAAGHDSSALKIEDGSSPAKSNLTVNSAASRGPNTPSFSNMISRSRPAETSEGLKTTTEMGKKGKKSTQVLLSTAGGRRY